MYQSESTLVTIVEYWKRLYNSHKVITQDECYYTSFKMVRGDREQQLI